MPITSNLLAQKGTSPNKIYVDRSAGLSRQQLKEHLGQLARRGQVTERDECLLETLRELSVLSLDQIWRLLWPTARPLTAYHRLQFLVRRHLLVNARIPRHDLAAWGLPVGNVYGLGPGGWLWLRTEVNQTILERYLVRELVLHDLLVAELYVRLVESVRQRGQSWNLTWAGEQAASFLANSGQRIIAPDGLGLVRQQLEAGKLAVLPFFVELDKGREAHGRPSSDWGRKVAGYNRFYTGDWKMHPQLANSPTFPWVAVVTHGSQRLLNLAESIRKHRQEPVTYYLTLWADLTGVQDMLAAPVWRIVTPEGKLIGQEPAQRQPLLRPVQTEAG